MNKLLCFLLPAICWSDILFCQHIQTATIKSWQAQAARVTITRDDWGIAHIHGRNDADAVFGLLYAQCEENFAKVEENNLEMLGRLSELKGRSELYNDLQMRLIYDSAAAQWDYNRAPRWMQALCTAAADGVNFYLFKHPEVKPAAIRHFEPWYLLMRTNGSISATQTGGIRLEDMQALYPVPGGATAMNYHPEQNGLSDPPGSNGFAVGPSRTVSGNAILYINPHVTFYFRAEIQMSSDEGLNAYGAVTWGTFFVFQGFNRYGGWMHTSGMADVADLFVEKTIRLHDSVFTELDGQLKPVQTRTTTIHCKTESGDSIYQFRLYNSYHGPVMGSRDGQWLSLREKNRSLEALEQSWLRTKTTGFAGFRRVMELKANTSDNTVYADRSGHIAYWHGNFMPHRSERFDYSLPVDGSVSASDWREPYPIDSLVHVYDPASGFIQNCNSSPFTVSGESSPVQKNYPVYLAPDGENFRGLNAARLLAASGNLNIDKMIRTIGYDPRLLFFDSLIPVVFRDWSSLDNTDTLKNSLSEAVARLMSWNRTMSDSSVALAIGIEYAFRLLKKLPPSTNRFAYGHNVDNLQRLLTITTTTERMQCLAETLVVMEGLYGNWRMAWGAINRYQRLPDGSFDDQAPSTASPLAPSDFGAIAAFGSRRLVNTTKRYGYYGNSFIACIEFGKRIKAKSIVTGGESFNPGSPHYADQLKGYLNGHFKPVCFYPDELKKHAKRRYHPGEQALE